jgi:hypothetical protein
MNADFYSNMLRGLSSINMTERERARAEDGVRKSAAIVECLLGIAGSMGLRSNQAERSS